MDKNIKFQLVWAEDGEILRDYETVEEVLEDIQWKDPFSYFVGEVETLQGYTIGEFIKKFKN